MDNASNKLNVLDILALKSNFHPDTRFVIPVRAENGELIGTMSCVDKGMVNNDDIVSDLTAWRMRFMRYFLTQFEATTNRTRDWLENIVIPSKNRLLFIIYLPNGEPVGSFGLCNMGDNSGELDNLIRGRKGGHPHLIYYCEIALLAWVFNILDYRKVYLHVFSNNRPVIKLHTSIGFCVERSIPLKKRISPGLVEYVLDDAGGNDVDFSYLAMKISKQKFLDLHPWVKEIYLDNGASTFGMP